MPLSGPLKRKANLDWLIKRHIELNSDQGWSTVRELLEEKAKRKLHAQETELKRTVSRCRRKTLQAMGNSLRRLRKAATSGQGPLSTEEIQAQITKLEQRHEVLQAMDLDWLTAVLRKSEGVLAPTPIQASAMQKLAGDSGIRADLQAYRAAWQATSAEPLDALQEQLKAAYAANPNLEGVRLVALLAAGRTGDEQTSKPTTRPSRQEPIPAEAGTRAAALSVATAAGSPKRKPGAAAGPQAPARTRATSDAQAAEAADAASELAESQSEEDTTEENAWEELDEEEGEAPLGFGAGWQLAGDSDDDTDAEGLAQMRSELKAALAEAKGKKKNRPGQRVRQLRAEKLFGEDARHVKQPERDANRRQQQKREEESRRKALQARPPKARSEKASARTQEEGPVHPSWEAKRRAKSATALAPFQGKRIRLDQEEVVVQSKRAKPTGPSAAVAVKAADLHPSWAAKQLQQQKAAMGGKGVKIKFDD